LVRSAPFLLDVGITLGLFVFAFDFVFGHAIAL
jgi:hypothetical protein